MMMILMLEMMALITRTMLLSIKLSKEQAVIAKIAGKDPERAAKRQKSKDYEVALKKLTGVKVLNDRSRLKTVVNKIQGRKKKSEKEWKKRKSDVEKSMKQRQIKRRKNIAKRHKDKVDRKIDSVMKKKARKRKE